MATVSPPAATDIAEQLPLVLPRDQKRTAARRRGSRVPVLLALADALGLTLAFLTSQLLVGGPGLAGGVALRVDVAFFVLLLPTWILGAKLFGLYNRAEARAAHSTPDDLVRMFLTASVCIFLVTHLLALTVENAPEILGLPRAAILDLTPIAVFWLFTLTFVPSARIAARGLALRSDSGSQPTIVVGAGETGQLIARKLVRHKEYGLKLVGFIDGNSNEPPSGNESVQLSGAVGYNDIPILGGLDSLESTVHQLNVRRVIFTFFGDGYGDSVKVIRTLRKSGVRVDVLPPFFELVGPACEVDAIEGLSLLGLPPVSVARSSWLMKRSIDVVGAVVGLIAAAPFFAVAAVLIKVSSPGPVFFRQTRLGKDMRPFTLIKFRTMKSGTDRRAHEDFIDATMRGDSPVLDNGLFKAKQQDAVNTRIGRWLRRTSLDELPQLLNVLRGDMSLVGPRPCLPYEVKHFEPHHFDRFLVPAGMTGLWQTSARAHASYAEALEMDVLYAQSWSVGLDLLLLARTPAQLVGAGATQ